MTIKKLSFKGDVKRKRAPRTTSIAVGSNGKSAEAVADEDDTDGAWVDAERTEDITGPCMLAHAYHEVPMAISVDARGSVFQTPLECSTLSQAEPHDVRQVFIAVPVGVDTVGLKAGTINKFLSVDDKESGVLHCDHDAIGRTDEWTLIKRPDGWALQSRYAQSSCITISHDSVQCTAQEIGFCETFRIRVQAQHKKKVKTGGEQAVMLMSRKTLEDKCGRTLTESEIDQLREAQKNGHLGETVLDMRVKGRSDKFG